MSLTPEEITKIRDLIKDPDFHEYTYKDHGCRVEKAFTAKELSDWKKNIDSIIKPSNTLVLEVGKKEFHYHHVTIGTGAGVGSYSIVADNIWRALPLVNLQITMTRATVAGTFYQQHTLRRLAAVSNAYAALGEYADGVQVYLYQVDALARQVGFTILAVLQRN